MTVPLVCARPDRLRRFRVTAGAMAEGLALRRAALGDAVEAYRSATERRYAADGEAAVDAVRALALAVRELGEWVGRVGDAFDLLPAIDGVGLGRLPELLAALPPELHLDGAGGSTASSDGGLDLAAIGLTVASAAATGAHPRDLEALASVVGDDTAAGRALVGAAGSARGQAVGRYLDLAQSIADGAREGWRRWRSEPHRDPLDRAGRAAVDGVIDATGGYGGSTAGAWAGALTCSGSVVATPVCASLGARGGGALGSAVAERVSDWILGDEPEPWEHDPAALAEEIADVDGAVAREVEPMLDLAASDADVAARRHADFVLDHPWLWPDEYDDAPVHAPPPPAPDVPAAGPR